jgi:hypothetical protein
MAFYVGKALQVAGLLGVGIALFVGLVHGDASGAMTREIGGAALGFALFWAGRMIELR